jgi:hypothetical protein
MKARNLLLASLLCGTALGVGWTWADFGSAPPLLAPPAERQPENDQGGLQPRLVIDATNHDFGTVEAGGNVRHAFRISNEGTGTLKLKAGKTSCSACTIAEIEKQEVPPGESTSVIVAYTAGHRNVTFGQTATVLTNDRQQPRLELSVSGKVTSKLVARPFELNLGNIAVGETATAQTKLLCLVPGKLQVVDHKFSNADMAQFFEVQTDPLTPQQLQAETAESGVLVMLSLKPGLPLGAFSQTIRFTLELDGKRSEYDVPTHGTVVSDLSIVGLGWREETGILTLGTVRSAQGLRRNVTVLVRGPLREQLQVESIRVSPAELRVTLGERTALNENVEQIPLNIEIPPGLSPMIRIGTDQWPFGEIVLDVKNHPDLKEVRMRLKFTIE